MHPDRYIEQLLAHPAALPELTSTLDAADVATLVAGLKEAADKHWWTDLHVSLVCADLIIGLGRIHNNTAHQALGSMTRGDTLKFLGNVDEAWDVLGQAGELFLQAGDQIGWARTRIGRVFICPDLNRVEEGLGDAERAHDVFARFGEREKIVRLQINTAHVHNTLGDQRRALALYTAALATAEELYASKTGNVDVLASHIGVLNTNIGNVYIALGELRQALERHEQARATFAAHNQQRGVALADLNLAHILMARGSFRQALHLLDSAHTYFEREHSPIDANNVLLDTVQCFLPLNRYQEAREMARRVRAVYHEQHMGLHEMRALLDLATAEAECGDLDGAHATLDQAEHLLEPASALSWSARIHMLRGRIALKQASYEQAHTEAARAMAAFRAEGRQIDDARAMLLSGEALFATGRVEAARVAAHTALGITRRSNVPPLRYNSHVLLGRIAESEAHPRLAEKHFKAALSTIERVQRGLTITLRPGFLEDKNEALHALLALQLRDGRANDAFATLERAKSQALLNYLTNRSDLRWANNTAQSRALVNELEQLRDEHHWLYQFAHYPPVADDEEALPTLAPQHALSEIAVREQRMRQLTEKLYLLGGEQNTARTIVAPSVAEIQAHLDTSALLLEFYDDGATWWGFVLTRTGVLVERLADSATVKELVEHAESNIAFAIQAGPHDLRTKSLAYVAQRLLQKLYDALLRPFAAHFAVHQRLMIVPYGLLHYVPFHLLHNGTNYLFEHHETVVLPTAALATRRAPIQRSGALAVAHSWKGRLPNTQHEAAFVQTLFGGSSYVDQNARRSVLQAPPTQILHIAAHAEYRLQQPELSYIALDDGQLYTDDLLQHDLSYELVTLSACETGRARVAARDELIGLGRGFLYAGAGALLVSLWRVGDEATLACMRDFYTHLHAGATKTAALRKAQQALLAQDPQRHPAFWGAFQVVGSADPLSSTIT